MIHDLGFPPLNQLRNRQEQPYVGPCPQRLVLVELFLQTSIELEQPKVHRPQKPYPHTYSTKRALKYPDPMNKHKAKEGLPEMPSSFLTLASILVR